MFTSFIAQPSNSLYIAYVQTARQTARLRDARGECPVRPDGEERRVGAAVPLVARRALHASARARALRLCGRSRRRGGVCAHVGVSVGVGGARPPERWRWRWRQRRHRERPAAAASTAAADTRRLRGRRSRRWSCSSE